MALVGPVGRGEPELVLDGTPYTPGFLLWGTNYLIWIGVAAVALMLAALLYRDAR